MRLKFLKFHVILHIVKSKAFRKWKLIKTEGCDETLSWK